MSITNFYNNYYAQINWGSFSEEHDIVENLNKIKIFFKSVSFKPTGIEYAAMNGEYILKIITRLPKNSPFPKVVRKVRSLAFRLSHLLFRNSCLKLTQQIPKSKASAVATEENSVNTCWFIEEKKDHPLGVYKPRLQVQGAIDGPKGKPARKGIPVGEECVREYLVSLINGELSKLLRQLPGLFTLSDFGVPFTEITAFESSLFGEHHEVGSYQEFASECKPAADMKTEEIDAIPDEEWIKVALLDLITLNTDRHLKNILVDEHNKKVIAIDHGDCLPELKSVGDVEVLWMYFSFAQKPLPKCWKKFILAIDEEKLIKKLLNKMHALNTEFPENQTIISEEAIFVLVGAIRHLKHWIKTCPDQPLFDYALNLCAQNLPFVSTKTDVFSLPYTFSEYKPEGKEILETYYKEYDFENVTARRIKVGGTLKVSMQSAYAEYKEYKGPLSVPAMIKAADSIFSKTKLLSSLELAKVKLS